MRKLAALVVLIVLTAIPAAAAPVDADHGPSVTTRVLEIVTGWLAKLGPSHDPDGAKNEDDNDRRDHFPPLVPLGPDFDPVG